MLISLFFSEGSEDSKTSTPTGPSPSTAVQENLDEKSEEKGAGKLH